MRNPFGGGKQINQHNQQISEKIQEATTSLENLQKAISLFPTYNADFYKMIEDLRTQTANIEQYKKQHHSTPSLSEKDKKKLLYNLEITLSRVIKTIEDVNQKVALEKAKQETQSESEWLKEVIAFMESPSGEHMKTLDDHIKELKKSHKDNLPLFFQGYTNIANFLEKKLKKSGKEAVKALETHKQQLINNLSHIPKEQTDQQRNVYIQYIEALQKEATLIIKDTNKNDVIQQLQEELKQIDPKLLATYKKELKEKLQHLVEHAASDEQFGEQEKHLMDAYERLLKTAITTTLLQQASRTDINVDGYSKIQLALGKQIDILDASILSSLEQQGHAKKDDYDKLVLLIFTLENNFENVNSIRQSINRREYKERLPEWTKQDHNIPDLEKLTGTDLDYLSLYANLLVTQLNPSQQEEILVDIQYQLEEQLRKINPTLLAAHKKALAEGLKVLTETHEHDKQLGAKAVDLLLGYTEILRNVIDEQRRVDNQLVQDLINLRLFIRKLPTYDFFEAQSIYKLITKQIDEISNSNITEKERLHKEKQLIKKIAFVISEYKQDKLEHVTIPTDLKRTLQELQNLSLDSEKFKTNFKNAAYTLEETLERFGEEGSILLAQHKQELFDDLLSADTESEKTILLNYLETLQQAIVRLIEIEPLQQPTALQDMLSDSGLIEQPNQVLATQHSGLDSSIMSKNTAPTSPIVSSRPSSARSSHSREETAAPQPISDSGMINASTSPIPSPSFAARAPQLFEPEEKSLTPKITTISALNDLLSDSVDDRHVNEKAKILERRQPSKPERPVRIFSPPVIEDPQARKKARQSAQEALETFFQKEKTKMEQQHIQEMEELYKKRESDLIENEERFRENILQQHRELTESLYSGLESKLKNQQQSDHLQQRQNLEQEALSQKTLQADSFQAELEKLKKVGGQLAQMAKEQSSWPTQHHNQANKLFEAESDKIAKQLQTQREAELARNIQLLEAQLFQQQIELQTQENTDRQKISEFANTSRKIAEQLIEAQQQQEQLRSLLEAKQVDEKAQLDADGNLNREQIRAHILEQQELIQQIKQKTLSTVQQEELERQAITMLEQQQRAEKLEQQRLNNTTDQAKQATTTNNRIIQTASTTQYGQNRIMSQADKLLNALEQAIADRAIAEASLEQAKNASARRQAQKEFEVATREVNKADIALKQYKKRMEIDKQPKKPARINAIISKPTQEGAPSDPPSKLNNMHRRR